MRKLYIADVGYQGPKSTKVSFVIDDNGVRPWAWVDNGTAAQLARGMVMHAEHVGTSKVETSYLKDGVEVELKFPRMQLFLGGTIEVKGPESEPLPKATFVISDEAKAYREAYMAKHAGNAAPSSDQDTSEPF